MNRKRRLALLVGAVLIAALAAAAFFFRAGDPPPDKTNGAQEAPISAENGSKADRAPSGERQHEFVQGADAEKVKAWINSYRQAVVGYDPTQDIDEKERDRLQRLAQELEQEVATFDINTHIAIHLELLYGHAGRPSNPKILELLEYDARSYIEEGLDDKEIGDRLSVRLSAYSLRSSKELDKIYQRMLDSKNGVVRNEGWKWNPNLPDKVNRIHEFYFENPDALSAADNGQTPREVIEILVDGMDDLTAAKYLVNEPLIFPEAEGVSMSEREYKYAVEYAERALAKDPTSRGALLVKLFSGADRIESARLLIEHHPTDANAVFYATGELHMSYPMEAVAALTRFLPEEGVHVNSHFHLYLGKAYERLDMLYEAADQYQRAYAAGSPNAASYRYSKLERGERSVPSIWEERAAAQHSVEGAETSAQPTQRPPDAPAPSETPRGVEPPPPPPNLEAEMSAAYADFAKAYQSAFEMEYGLSEATPEGYMNALLGMARAFARAGDAERAQDAYNAARKRYSPEEIQQAFRRFDEQERLRRQASNEQDDGEDDGEDE